MSDMQTGVSQTLEEAMCAVYDRVMAPVQLKVKLPPELLDDLKAQARLNKISVNSEIIERLKQNARLKTIVR